jgi:hypothetical protein
VRRSDPRLGGGVRHSRPVRRLRARCPRRGTRKPLRGHARAESRGFQNRRLRCSRWATTWLSVTAGRFLAAR